MVFSYTIFTETLFGILYSELMVIGLEGILLNSENARELAEWYRDTKGTSFLRWKQAKGAVFTSATILE